MKPQDLQRLELTQATLLTGQLRREIKMWKRRHADALANLADVQAQHDLLVGADVSHAAPLVIEPRTHSGAGEAVALAAAGDWHVFERVKPAEVNGLNCHNRTEAHHRIEALARGIVRWVQIHRGGTNIHTLILSLLGDLMTNQIHADQLEGNDGTPQEELLFLYEHIIGVLEHLKAEGGFHKIIVTCNDGNHGRDTEKLRNSNRVQHSHEWLLYKLLAQHYAGRHDKVVEFRIAEGTHLYYTVFEKTIRQHHGDAIRYFGGVGGPTISIRKAIAEWDKGCRADFDVFGHFHTRIMDGKFLCNGSLIGYSPYALTIKAPFEPPSQSLLLLDKKRWITSDNRIFVR